MIHTVTTDASYSTRIKKGTFAFQIKSDNGCVQRFGPLKGEIECSAEAELKAIGNALSVLCGLGTMQPKDLIIINTDCFAAIKAIKNQHTKRGSPRLKLHARSIFKYLVKVPKVRHELRHVKGHSTVQDKRSHVNRWCDMKAGEEMKKLLLAHGITVNLKPEDHGQV